MVVRLCPLIALIRAWASKLSALVSLLVPGLRDVADVESVILALLTAWCRALWVIRNLSLTLWPWDLSVRSLSRTDETRLTVVVNCRRVVCVLTVCRLCLSSSVRMWLLRMVRLCMSMESTELMTRIDAIARYYIIKDALLV